MKTPTVQAVVFEAATFDGALAWCGLAGTDHGLAATTFGHKSSQEAWRAVNCRWNEHVRWEGLVGRPPQVIDRQWIEIAEPCDRPPCDSTMSSWERDLWAVSVQMFRFLSGEPTTFGHVPLDLRGLTDFQRDVTAACCGIEWGRTSTYAELAHDVGRPRAARAVGGVMRRNRLPLVVPCHRVVGAQGKLTGFSAPDGIAMKQRLLTMEQIALKQRAERLIDCAGLLSLA
ncbi:MAG: methylated-DNA--[protein]-cysteine S-methyltransferase [Planctomycetota bacterium]|nr:methylated-DNA--[protein]-cysteine S-methyltransferase [Planctomycetota bacterium]